MKIFGQPLSNGVPQFDRRFERNLIIGLVAFTGIVAGATVALAESDRGGTNGCGSCGVGATGGTANNPFNGPTQGLRGQWDDNVRSVWAVVVEFRAWVNTWRAMPDCCQNRYAIVADRVADGGGGNWSVHTAGRGYWHGVN